VIDTFRRDSSDDDSAGQDGHSGRFNLDSPIEEEGGNLSIGQVRDPKWFDSKQKLIASFIAIPGVTRPCTR
jgi:hypothetical protein